MSCSIFSDEWARNRDKYFLKHPQNAATLKEIESAAFILTLDDGEYSYDPVRRLSYFARYLIFSNFVFSEQS